MERIVVTGGAGVKQGGADSFRGEDGACPAYPPFSGGAGEGLHQRRYSIVSFFRQSKTLMQIERTHNTIHIDLLTIRRG